MPLVLGDPLPWARLRPDPQWALGVAVRPPLPDRVTTDSTNIRPRSAVCFLLTGLASVGFPATLGFISTELLVDSAVEASPYVGVAVVAAAALNGIAVVRAYFLLFTGARHMSSVSLGIGLRERTAVLTFSALILGGGVFPQPGVTTRQRAAEIIREEREIHPRLGRQGVPTKREAGEESTPHRGNRKVLRLGRRAGDSSSPLGG